MRGFALLCFAAILAAARPAPASEQSESLSARALVELQKGDTAAAMKLFDQAVAADPQDATALYQRGAALAKEKKYEEALPDLKAALAIRPNLNEAALELGIALVELKRNEEARPWLLQAQKQPDLDGQASFFLGIADMRDGKLDSARANFERARAKDPSVDVSSRYYLGVIEYRAGNAQAASDHFAFVQQQSPESAVGRESANFLQLIQGGQSARTHVYGGVSIQYDTNVVLAPATGVAATGQADGRVTLNAGGVYVPWRTENSRLSVGYDFYQNLQFHLTDFNLQDHRPTIQFIHDFGLMRAAMLAQYDYYFLDGSSFLQQVTAVPYVVIPEEGIGRTEIYLRFEWLDYLQTDFDQLSGYDYAGGIRQVIALGEEGQEVWIGYEGESMDTTHTKLYAFDASQVEISLLWPLPWDVFLQASYRFRFEDYDAESAIFPPPGDPRRDDENRGGVAFRKDLNQYISFVAAWIGTFNLSNKEFFQYNRQIGSLGVEVRY